VAIQSKIQFNAYSISLIKLDSIFMPSSEESKNVLTSVLCELKVKSQVLILIVVGLKMSYGRDSGYGRGRGRSYGGSGNRGFNRGSPGPKPVEAGKEYEVDITEISRRGDGIAKVQDFVVFVENGKVGDKVKVKVTQVADRFAKATIVP
jgi:predicted RNA-binding protein with TRAM domain